MTSIVIISMFPAIQMIESFHKNYIVKGNQNTRLIRNLDKKVVANESATTPLYCFFQINFLLFADRSSVLFFKLHGNTVWIDDGQTAAFVFGIIDLIFPMFF